MSRLTPREILLESLSDEVLAVLKEQGIVSKTGSFPDKLDKIMGHIEDSVVERDLSRIADIDAQWYTDHIADYEELQNAPEYVQGVSAGLQIARGCLESA